MTVISNDFECYAWFKLGPIFEAFWEQEQPNWSFNSICMYLNL